MIKSFLLLNLVLIVMVVSITLHYSQSNRDFEKLGTDGFSLVLFGTKVSDSKEFGKKESTQALQTITELTSQSKLSLSVAYDESSYNPTYPEMPNLKKMDFVYE